MTVVLTCFTLKVSITVSYTFLNPVFLFRFLTISVGVDVMHLLASRIRLTLAERTCGSKRIQSSKDTLEKKNQGTVFSLQSRYRDFCEQENASTQLIHNKQLKNEWKIDMKLVHEERKLPVSLEILRKMVSLRVHTQRTTHMPKSMTYNISVTHPCCVQID